MEHLLNRENWKYSVDRQIAGNSDLNLFYNSFEDEIEIADHFRDTALLMKRESLPTVNALLDYVVRRTLETVYRINQFITLSENDKASLRSIYRRTLAELDHSGFDSAMRRHYRRLASWISPFYPKSFIEELKTRNRIGSVKNEEYSAEFQENLMGIDVNSLREPIVDIGCGKNAHLVRYLEAKKKKVLGIDRFVEEKNSFVREMSWFDFSFEKSSWGTIIANMSFSNHIIYAMNNDSTHLQQYFLKYREIIHSLKEGGEFIYAPSLLFIEERLDSGQFEVSREKAAGRLAVTRMKRVGGV